MKNKILLMGIFLILNSLSQAQELKSKKIDKKYGFFDETGKEVISPAYDRASDFSEGLAAVMKNNKWGYIDTKGDIKIPFVYQWANDFREGLALVTQKDKCGYVDKDNKIVIPFHYQGLGQFKEGLAYAIKNDKYGFIDITDKEIIPFNYEDAHAFQEGLAGVKFNNKWGYIDRMGREIIPFNYEDAYVFVEGLAEVKLNGKWGYIDTSNNIIIPIKYDAVTDFYDGIASVRLNGTTYYIDKSGDVVWYQEELVTSPDKISAPINDRKVSWQEIKRARIHDKYGFVDNNGKIIISPQYDDARDFSEGLAAVKLGNSWGFINAEDKVDIPFMYASAGDFSNGLAKVSRKGYWGCIDKSFNEKIPLQYDEVTRYSKQYSDDVFIVRQNETITYLNRYGGEISKAESSRIEKELNDIKIEQAGVKKETILGNMVIEKRIDESGTILTIGDQPVNIKFSSYKKLAGADVYSFDVGSEKSIYFKSGNDAVKCSYALPTYEGNLRVAMPEIPWPGEVNPVPEVLMTIGDKLRVTNAFNGKTIILPFELFDNNSIVYDNEVYAIESFIHHAHINFICPQLDCRACEGHGYIQGKDEYEIITKTTYKEETEKVNSFSEYRSYDVVRKKVPVTTTEKVLKPGKAESCQQCKGAGILKQAKYIQWDGEKFSTVSKG